MKINLYVHEDTRRDTEAAFVVLIAVIIVLFVWHWPTGLAALAVGALSFLIAVLLLVEESDAIEAERAQHRDEILKLNRRLFQAREDGQAWESRTRELERQQGSPRMVIPCNTLALHSPHAWVSIDLDSGVRRERWCAGLPY
jgi:hypothetical protein